MPTAENLCSHEITIGKLEHSVTTIEKGLEEIKANQKETVRILERISSQETRINKLEDDQEEVFVRLRKVELDVNTISAKIGIWAAIIGAIIAAVISSLAKKFV